MQLKTSGTEAVARLRGIANAIRHEVTGGTDEKAVLLVHRLASSPISAVGPKTTLTDVVEELVGDDVGMVAVMEEERVIGLVSERDIVDAISDGAELDTVWAADVMATDLAWIGAEDTLDEAASRMRDMHLRHLLVAADEGGPAVVSIRDVLSGLMSPEGS